jgi:hypothetical protein
MKKIEKNDGVSIHSKLIEKILKLTGIFDSKLETWSNNGNRENNHSNTKF